MPIRRQFIDWCRPGLHAAVDWLLARPLTPGPLDLSGWMVVVPAARAGRRLLDLLVERAEDAGQVLVPPQIVTVGHFPERLYHPSCPPAELLTQQLAWVAALKACDRERLGTLVRQLPDDDNVFAWFALGDMLAALHRELAGDRLTCADVLRHGREILSRKELNRWAVLADVQQRYLTQLKELNLCDPQYERLAALDGAHYRADCDVLLLGTVDLNAVQRAILQQVAERVTAAVLAPEELADRFDEFGCVRPHAWQTLPTPLEEFQIQIVDGPGDQATAAVSAIAGFDGQYAADQIVVGVPDGRLVPYVEQRLEECGIPARYGAGTQVRQTEPYRLLDAVAAFLETRRFKTLADLLRHPAVEQLLAARGVVGDWLTELDRYYGGHLPWQATGTWLADREEFRTLPRVDKELARWLKALGGRPRPLADWSKKIAEVLIAAYGRSDLDLQDDRQRQIALSCEQIQQVLREQADVPEALAPKVTATQALRFTLRRLEGAEVPPRSNPDAVELVGWLELPLDDAPAVVVTGFNEGVVPTSRNGDAFLPNELRRHLKLEDNDRRFARDVYTLAMLAACKPELRIVAGRRTGENDPLIPSRLLFLCPDDELPVRTRRLLEPSAAISRLVLPGSLRPGMAKAKFEPPRPVPLDQPVTSMRVTEFRDYLACPYRYYLRHRLGLKTADDTIEELDAGQFGTLLHDVLTDFKDEIAGCVNPREIEDFLNHRLDRRAKFKFGETPQPAVLVQVEMVRARLRAFAQWQAGWARQGWRVVATECDIPEDVAALEVDGEPMFLRGRIDRIDVHERSGQVMIFDYKTGDAARAPDDTHRHKQAWVDLQLPLYWYTSQWLDEIAVGADVAVGYVLLPKDTKKVDAARAEWAREEFEDAVKTAVEIVRRVRREVFWPRVDPAPALFDEFAAICGDDRLGSAPSAAEEDED